MPGLRTASVLAATAAGAVLVSVAVAPGAVAAPAARGVQVDSGVGGPVQVTLWRGEAVDCPATPSTSARPGAVVAGLSKDCFRLARRVMTVHEPRDVQILRGRDGAGWRVYLTFNAEQRRAFTRVSAAAVGHELAMLDGDRLITAPTVMEAITTGQFEVIGLTLAQARRLAHDLERSSD